MKFFIFVSAIMLCFSVACQNTSRFLPPIDTVLSNGHLYTIRDCTSPWTDDTLRSFILFRHHDGRIDSLDYSRGCIETMEYQVIGDSVIVLLNGRGGSYGSGIVYELNVLENNHWKIVGWKDISTRLIHSKHPLRVAHLKSWDEVTIGDNEEESYRFFLNGEYIHTYQHYQTGETVIDRGFFGNKN